MNEGKIRIGAATLAIAIAATLGATSASAAVSRESERAVAARLIESGDEGGANAQELLFDAPRSEYNENSREVWEKFLALGSVQNKSVYSYQRKTVKVGGTVLSRKSLTIGGVDYIPSRLASGALGLTYNYNSASKSVTITGKGLNMSFSNGCYVSYANGRALFSTMPSVIMSDGVMYIPAEIFAKAVGMKLATDGSSVSISGKLTPIISGDKFYRADEVLWLARIIHAEASGEPLLGKIAVGNVVLNRVRSAYYPNTIYGVIFDRKYGVQFSPVLDGSIYNTPSYNSILAAKICLDGADVSDGAFFFLRPEISSSSWIPNNRRYAFSIGKHDFYY
ncbi:MAG: cell wall hydrolase [Clostridia bacterium]|nr:cell wall hydrolase [Clostridia bacterium]